MVEYALQGSATPAPNSFRLVANILDPEHGPAQELVAVDHERWEIEVAFDQLKPHLRQRRRVLRSKTPELVRQELYGRVLEHNAVRWLLHQGASLHRVPDAELSFEGQVELLRRTQPQSWAFPPRRPDVDYSGAVSCSRPAPAHKATGHADLQPALAPHGQAPKQSLRPERPDRRPGVPMACRPSRLIETPVRQCQWQRGCSSGRQHIRRAVLNLNEQYRARSNTVQIEGFQ